MAAKLSYALEKKLTQPQNFYGVGGMKIFRDLIYLMRGMMKADHKFYKEHKQYDFPQKQKGTLIKMYLVGMLISNPKIKGKACLRPIRRYWIRWSRQMYGRKRLSNPKLQV